MAAWPASAAPPDLPPPAVHVACARADLARVQEIATAENVGEKDAFGWTPLHYAASAGAVTICRVLVAHAALDAPGALR